MNIIYKKTSEIVPYGNNPRSNDNAVVHVMNSICEFGFKIPIIIDKDNVIVCGHTRVKAAQKLDIEEVPCIIADDLTDEQVSAFRLVDNKTAEFASWDFDKLREELDKTNIDLSEYNFPQFDGLDISDEDFLQDTEILKDKRDGKTVKCPHCGKDFEI